MTNEKLYAALELGDEIRHLKTHQLNVINSVDPYCHLRVEFIDMVQYKIALAERIAELEFKLKEL